MKTILYDWYGYNSKIFLLINNNIGSSDNILLNIADQIGMYRSFPAILPLIILWGFFSINKHRDNPKKFNEVSSLWFKTFSSLVISMVLMFMVVGFLKPFMAFNRPFCTQGLHEVIVSDSILSSIHCERSFPSGHTAYTTMLVLGLFPVLSKLMRGIGVVTIVLVATSRMAAGVHYPADIMGGFLISLFILIIVSKIVEEIFKKTSTKTLNLVKEIIK